MKVYVRVIPTPDSSLTVVCDEDIIGKVFEENETILDIKESYYKGDLVDLSQVESYFKPGIMQVVGKHAVSYLVEKNVITKDDVKYVENVPYINVLFEK